MEEEAPKEKKKFNFKDKKILGLVGVVIVIIVLALGAFLVFGNNDSSSEEDIYDTTDSSSLPELSPEDIGMVVTIRDDQRALMFELTKADDIEYVEYIIEYEAETEEGTANQGIFGEMNIGKDGITETDFREFGTCSAGRCRYDDVISDVTINLKVRKTDGKEYKVTEIVELEEAS